MKFTDTLQLLISEKGITKNKMLTDLGLGTGTFNTWLKRDSLPNGDTLVKIAKYFGVSTDYLLGLTPSHNSKEIPSLDILNRIISLLEIQHKTQKDLTDYLGVQNTTFTKWKAGDNTSYMKYLPKIATFLSVSADYLINGEPSEQKNIPLNAEASNGMKENETIRFYTEPAQSQTPFLGVMPTSKPYFAGGQPLDTNTPSPSSEGHSKSQAAAMELDELSSTMLQLFSKLSTLDKCKIISTLEELSKEK